VGAEHGGQWSTPLLLLWTHGAISSNHKFVKSLTHMQGWQEHVPATAAPSSSSKSSSSSTTGQCRKAADAATSKLGILKHTQVFYLSL
jgi:hypothetical protein